MKGVNARATLLDTNVVSELLRPRPDVNVVGFVEGHDDLLVSAIAFHELELGLAVMPEGKKKATLSAGVEAFRLAFDGRIVGVDMSVAAIAGKLRAAEIQAGYDGDGMDALIGACAIASSARLATRNIKDFARMGVELVNPWSP